MTNEIDCGKCPIQNWDISGCAGCGEAVVRNPPLPVPSDFHAVVRFLPKEVIMRMMIFLFFCVIVVAVFGISNDAREKKKMDLAIATADEAFRFIEYCEDHKDELPTKFQERFDEMVERIASKKEAVQ